MHRHALTEDQWRQLQAVLPKQKAAPPATRGDPLFIEAVLFRAKTGMPWRDLPERFSQFIADTGYDSNRFRQAIRDKKRAVIGSKPERPRKLPKSAANVFRRVLLSSPS